ncbi:MAG: nucleotidyltransferase domain-containing protein [Acidobacteria bacterium]|nr:nucleotidyltransferase domain-containing protein [Acidobacteriota bacterium]
MDSNKYILSKVKHKIKEIDPYAKVILFGSRARDDYHKDSDWDFLILTRLVITQDLKNKISDSLFETELETDNVLTGIVQNFDSWNSFSASPIFKNIAKDGVEI